MLMNKPLVSFYIPVYNAQDYIDECLQSILNQSYTNIEIYAFLDVKSSDSSKEILQEYVKKYNNIYIKDKYGQADAIDDFTSIANGDYLMMVDNDDYIEKDLVKKVVDCFENNDIDGVIYAYRFVDKDGKLMPWAPSKLENKIVDKKEVLADFLTTPNIEGFRWNKAYKKGIYKDFKFDPTYPVDLPSEFNLLRKCNKIAYLDYCGYNYRQRPDSWVNTFNLKEELEMFDVYTSIRNKAKEEGLLKEGNYYLIHCYVDKMFGYIKGRKTIAKQDWETMLNANNWNSYLNISLNKALHILSWKALRDSKLETFIKTLIVYYYTKINYH